MPKPRVYVETTIPNVYHETRTAPESVKARLWTRAWWADASDRYDLVTSAMVVEELLNGAHDERVGIRKSLLRDVPLLPVTTAISDTVAAYLRHKLMPARPSMDAYHLAIASHHYCDFLVSWNCRHLANPHKALHIRRINTMLGLHVPELVTPKDLLQRRSG